MLIITLSFKHSRQSMLEQSFNSRNTPFFLSGNGSNISDTVMHLIIRTIQLFEHPPFPGKMMYSNHSSTHIWNYYSNIWTRTPCKAWSGVTERLQDLDSLCGTPTEFAELLLAFDSLCGTTTKVTEYLLAYYRHYWTSTRLLQSFPNIYWTPTVTVKLERGLPNMY